MKTDASKIQPAHAPRFPLILQMIYRGSARPIVDCAEKLATGGMFIRTPRDIRAGEKIPIIVSCPGFLEPVVMLVEVVRKCAPTDTEPAGVKVRLVNDADDERGMLARLAAAAVTRQQRGKASYRLVLVESNMLLAQTYGEALEKIAAGVDAPRLHLDFAMNGPQALKLVAAEPQANVLITPLRVRGMDGFELISKVRTDPRCKDLPVVLTTGGGLTSDEQRRLDAMRRIFFLPQPLDLRDLVRTVRVLLVDTSRAAATDNAR